MIALSKSSDSVLRNCRVEESGVHVSNRGVYLKEYFDHYHSDSELQQKIESAVAEHDQATQDTIQGYMDNEQQLLEQIEELKAKLPQPIEISRELSDAIEHMKNIYGVAWEYQFLSNKYNKDIDSKELSKMPYYQRVEIIKNGYTVKPEPTLQNQIENILRALEYDFSGVEEAAKEIVIVLKHEGMLKDEEA